MRYENTAAIPTCDFCTLDILVRDLTEKHALVAGFHCTEGSSSKALIGCATDMNVHPTGLSLEYKLQYALNI